MSTPQPPQPAQNTSTRQLLDELDDLMQRMLALPVQQVEEEPAAPAGADVVPSVAAPRPLSEPATRALPPAPPEDDPPETPPPPAPRQETPPAGPAPTPRLPLPYTPRGQRLAARARPHVPAWYLRPVVWGNHTFDRCTGWFGGPGRWLRSPGGRTLLGWTGLLMLGAALAWGILKWIG